MADILDAINEIIEITLRETNYLAGVIFEKDYVDLTLTLRLHRALLCGQENGAAYDKDDNVRACNKTDTPGKRDLHRSESYFPISSELKEEVGEEEYEEILGGEPTVKNDIKIEDAVSEEDHCFAGNERGCLEDDNEIEGVNNDHHLDKKKGGKRAKNPQSTDVAVNVHEPQRKKKGVKRKSSLNATEKAPLKLRHVCNVCGKRTHSRKDLAKHLGTHTTEKPIACSLCDFRTKTEDNLKRHMIIHLGLKPHKCSLCGMDFRSKENLRDHMNGRHAVEKKYSCEYCEFKAKTSQCVKAHVKRMHLPSTVYKCDKCGKRTMDEYKHKSHMLAHESNISFNCQCGLKYTNKSEFDRHFKRAHSGEKTETKRYKTEPSVCRLCGRSYTNRSTLKRHRDRHHPNELFHHCGHCAFSTDIKAEYIRHISSLMHIEKISNGSNEIT